MIPVYQNMDFSGLQAQNLVFHSSLNVSPPSAPVAGMPWWESDRLVLDIYDGSDFLPVPTGPVVSTPGNIPIWSNNKGNKLEDGYAVETTLVGSPDAIPTAEAVLDYVGANLFERNAGIISPVTVTDKLSFGTIYVDHLAEKTLNNGVIIDHSLTVAGSFKAAGYFYSGTSAPTNTNRLNYDGNLYATNIYSGGTLVSVVGHTHSYEPVLGNPAADGYILSSTAGGTRSWVPNPYVLPVDDILDWSTNKYTPYDAQSSGKLDNSTTAPTHSTARLNYDGQFFVYNLTATGPVQTNEGGAYTKLFGESAIGYLSTWNPTLRIQVHGDNIGVINHTNTGHLLYLDRIAYASNTNLTYDAIHINDNPTTSGTIGGAIFKATVGADVRISFEPRVPDSGSAVAYFIDTHEELATAGSKLLSVRNQGTEKMFLDYSGVLQVESDIYAGFLASEDYAVLQYTGLKVYVTDTERLNLDPSVGDSATAKAYFFDTANALSTSGSKLLSISNQGVEKFYITYEGEAYANGVHLGVGGGGGDVYKSGTPVDNQIAIWTDGTHIEGTSNLIYNDPSPTYYPTLWLGRSSPDGTNYALRTLSTSLQINGPTGGSVSVRNGSALVADFMSNGLYIEQIYVNHIGERTSNHGVVFDNTISISGTTKAAGFFYAGTTDPTNTNRLNYDGNLWVNALYVRNSSNYWLNENLRVGGLTFVSNLGTGYDTLYNYYDFSIFAQTNKVLRLGANGNPAAMTFAGDGTQVSLAIPLKVDHIGEYTANHGVVIDACAGGGGYFSLTVTNSAQANMWVGTLAVQTAFFTRSGGDVQIGAVQTGWKIKLGDGNASYTFTNTYAEFSASGLKIDHIGELTGTHGVIIGNYVQITGSCSVSTNFYSQVTTEYGVQYLMNAYSVGSTNYTGFRNEAADKWAIGTGTSATISTMLMAWDKAGVFYWTNYFEFNEITAPSAPAANKGRLYMDTSDEKLYWKTSSTTYDLTAGSGTTPVDDILDWSTDKYTPWSDANKAAGRLYSITTTYPTNSTNLAYDGNLYAVSFTSGTASTNYTQILGTSTQIVVSSTTRTSLIPGVADSGSGIAYTFDTANVLTSGRKLISIKNQGSELVYIDNFGSYVGAVVYATSQLIAGAVGATTNTTIQNSSIVMNISGTTRFSVQPSVADGGTAYTIDTSTSLTSGKIVSFLSAGSEKLYIDYQGYIYTPAGSLKHMSIFAGNASGAAGTDAGNVVLKAGNAIASDSNSVNGAIYLVPGDPYQVSGTSSYIYLGSDTHATPLIGMYVKSSESNASLSLYAKGTGSITVGSGNGVIFLQGTVYLYSSTTISGIGGNSSISGYPNAAGIGYDLTIKGGTGYTGYNGGNLYLQGGTPGGGGALGLIYAKGNLYPEDDDTYYLGKNSISTPKAWKALVLKDTTNGNYYRITVVSGTLTTTQIT